MRLEVIKHRRVSLKVPSPNGQMELEGNNDENDGIEKAKTTNANGLRERRKMQQKLRIDTSMAGGHAAHWPMASPYSVGDEWRRRALEGQRAAEEVNRWISSGDLAPLEALVLAGRADLLLGSEHRENFIFGHSRSKQFLAQLPEYKEKYEQFLEAIVAGDAEIVRNLLEYGQLALAQSRHPRTHSSTAHLATIFEHPTILQILLDKEPTLLDSRDSEGRTPLHYAAAFAGILRSEGQGEQHSSTNLPQLECFDVLLDAGANESLIDLEGYTPMNFHRSPQLLDMRQIRGLNKFPIWPGDHVDELIAERDVKALRQIVLEGEYSTQIEGRIFPAECRDLAPMLAHLQMRIRAIHEAILDDDQLTLKQLVDDWDTAVGRDEHGRTPLHLAVLHGRPRIARYLLLLFPKCVDLVDKANRTPLHYASCLTDEQQRAQMTRILCRAGAESATMALRRANNLGGQLANNNNDDDDDGHEKLPMPLMDGRQNDDDLDEARAMDLRWKRIGQGGGGKGDDGQKEEEEDEEEDGFSEGDDAVDSEVERRLLSIDFGQKQYGQLEKLHAEGLTAEIWRVVKKHLGNEKLVKYIYAYRQAQNRLGQTFAAIEANDMRRVKSLLDEEIVQARDIRGLAPLHVAVLKERHEMVEQIAHQFPAQINIADHLGRTAAHYAAPQQNAIYETLADAGADVQIADKNGFSAEVYRQNPQQMVQPLPLLLNVPNEDGGGGTRNGLLGTLRSMRNPSFDDASTLFDPDAPSDEQVRRWLTIGDVQQLEQIVLDGRAHLLADKSSTNIGSAEFLQGIAQYQSKIDSIHKAVEEGDVRRVKSLIDRNLLATARDRHGMTPLHKALLYGQTNTVRFLLAKFPHCVNEPDHAGRTALHYAAADANGEHMIKVLQKAGGDAFIEDKYGHTPFYYRTHGKRLNIRTLKDNAVINQLISGQLNRPLLQDLEEDITDWVHTGNIGKLEELILNGYADLLLGRNHQLEDAEAISFLEVLPQYQAKIQAIHKAIEQGNLRAVKLLTDRKKLALCRDSRGLAPLHKAVVFGQTEIAKYLIRNYPQSVNAMDQRKRTPLHYAASLRDGGYLYKLMRKAGADPNIFDCNGRPPKYYLKYPGELNLERMRLDTKQALKQILHNRVAPSYLESNIQQWLREGNLAKLDQLVMSGCADLLMEKKSANPDAQLFLRELPELIGTIEQIHRAVKEGRLEIVKQLMTTKRLALARDRHGCTPLHTAIIHEQTEIIRFIAATFPSVLNAPDYNKRTAMHYAAAARDGGHYLKILGKAGADPMAVDNEGRTPDYYRRNAVFDLKMLKERDAEEFGAETLLAQSGLGQIPGGGGHIDFENGLLMDSPAESVGELSGRSSGVDSGRRGNGDEEEEDLEKNRFERLLHERLEMPTSDNGLYLARTVAPVLTKALAEVLLRRPANPIGFISDWLIQYMEEGKDF